MHGIEIKGEKDLKAKIQSMNFGLMAVILVLGGCGVLALYSAAAGHMNPWANQHVIRLGVGFAAMVIIALIDIQWWYRLAWPAYFAGLGLLLFVELMGHIGMGAQRWIDLGFMKLQPSELMKIAVIMVLARVYHNASPENTRRLGFLIFPALIIALPMGLILLQPDLGTSLMLAIAGGGLIFLGGAPLWIFGVIAAVIAGSIPVIWSLMHEYQKKRVMTFLDPESDPLGAGYHITQSKIALGSGGIDGKGFLQGTQSKLNFLPEKQTDFIFTLWAEEWGLIGGLFLLFLFSIVFFYALWIGLRAKSMFGRMLAIGIGINFSLYVFINIAMVMGLIPVVGAPLPLISYGGTVIISAMAGFGLMMSVHIHRYNKIYRASL